MECSMTPWNKDTLLQRVINNQPIFITLLTVFIETIPKLVEQLDQAILVGNFTEIESLAHNLKGSSYNVTANIVGDIAKEIEYASKRQDIKCIKKDRLILQRELARVISAFSDELVKNNNL